MLTEETFPVSRPGSRIANFPSLSEVGFHKNPPVPALEEVDDKEALRATTGPDPTFAEEIAAVDGIDSPPTS